MPDDKPCCSSFANWVTKASGESGSGRPNTQSWLNWGKEVSDPVYGAIAVVKGSKGQGKDAKGHVGFVVGQTTDARPILLGGNQDQEVNKSVENRAIYSYRVPTDYAPLKSDHSLPVVHNVSVLESDR